LFEEESKLEEKRPTGEGRREEREIKDIGIRKNKPF